MSEASSPRSAEALDAIDIADPELYERDAWGPPCARLRALDPVHYCARSEVGPYWAITRYDDVVEISKHPERFSSDRARGGSTLQDARNPGKSLIQMDPPEHIGHRRQVAPALSPSNLRRLEPEVRARTAAILDAIPVGETFDWVERVATELPIQMLATLFGVPQADRYRLLRWSNKLVAGISGAGGGGTGSSKLEFQRYFEALLERRRHEPPGPDLASRLALAPQSVARTLADDLQTIAVLVVGGNDTTRNTLSGGLHALCTNPEQFERLRADRGLIPTAIDEILRVVSPVLHQRRTAVHDLEFRGRSIRAGDKLGLFYVSANRDESKFSDPDRFDVGRREARHLAFGIGTHFCVGSRLAELQLRCFWEGLLERHPYIELRGEPVRLRSSTIHGFLHLPVRVVRERKRA